MRTNYNTNLDCFETLNKLRPVVQYILELTADDYNNLPLSIKQAIEFIYDHIQDTKHT